MAGKSVSVTRQAFLWGFPLGSFAATWFYWPFVQGAGFAFPLFLLAASFIYALVVIRLTTRYLRLWSWRMPMLHLAFLWSTYPAIGILLLSDTIAAPFSAATFIKSVAFSALAGAGVGTLVDVVGVDEDLLKVHHSPKNLGTVKTVLSYSFKFFGLFGALYGISAKLGHYFLVELEATYWLPVVILCGSAVLCLPFISYFLLSDKERQPAHKPSAS